MRYFISFGYTTKCKGFVKQSECSFVCDGSVDDAVDMMEVKFIDWRERNPSRARRRTAVLYTDDTIGVGMVVKVKHCDRY